jgi:hypothetical protein
VKLSLAFLAVCAIALTAQDRSAELKHLAISTATSLQPVKVAALEIVRDLPYTSVVHLRGSVEIRTPICLVTGPGTTHTCGGYMVLRADRADFHEDSGQIDASGNVRVTREN